MEILAVVPIDDEVSVQDVTPKVSASDQTVRKYLEQMVRDGWLERRRANSLMRYRRLWHLDKFWDPMDLPTAIWIDNDVIVGPFCANCGWTLSLHGGPNHRCRTETNRMLGVPGGR